jgi:uncharacterized protein YigE (DUF2233 family)
VEYRVVEWAGKRATVCEVDVRKEALQLMHRDEKGVPFQKFETLSAWLKAQGKTLRFGMNAGMYHADYSAVGLYVAGGKVASPLNTADGWGNFFLKPIGVFALTNAGARVVETSEYPALSVRERVEFATQSGPMLVHQGRIHPAFNAESKSRLLRNGVGVPSPGTALFVIADEPWNFYEFATLFRDSLKCPNALFLDGNVCSLHSPELKRSDFKIALGPLFVIVE